MPSSSSSTRVFVGNLPDDVRSRELHDLFYKYGDIVDVDIKIGRNPGSGAFAFVEFESSRAAEEAVSGRDGIKFAERRLRVEFSGGARRAGFRSGPPHRTPYRVIVEELPSTASWQDLKDHMRTAGRVGYADAHNGSGVVEYETEDDMNYAVRKLDNSEFRNKYGSSLIRVFADMGGDAKRRRSRSRSPRRQSRSPSPRGRRSHRSASGSRNRRGSGGGSRSPLSRRSPSSPNGHVA